MEEDNRKIIYENLDALKKDVTFFENEILKVTKNFINKNYIEKIKKMGYELEIHSGGHFTKRNSCIYDSGIFIQATKDRKDVRYNDYEPDLAYVCAGWQTMRAKKKFFKDEVELIVFKYDEELMNEELGDMMNMLEDEENIRII